MTDYFSGWMKDSEESLAPIEHDLRPHRDAIAKIESGGDYQKLGPVTKKGDRALGKYQVMAANLPEWSQAALGRTVTPKEFLSSPELQDKVFDHRFGQYLKEHGPADAASLWFTGKPLAEGAGRKDQLGTSGSSYVKQYLGHLGVAPPSASPGLDELNRQFQVEFLDKSYPKEAKETPQIGTPNPIPVPTTGPSWGALQNLGSEALLKTGPAISGYAQASREMFGDMARGVPREEAARLAREVYYPQAKAQYEQGQEGWAKANPGTALTTEMIGQIAPIFAGVRAMNEGLRGAAAIVPRLAPAANFLTGAGAATVPGVGGVAVRTAGDVATGALQGGLANAVVGEDPAQGAMWGGALGVPFGAVSRALSAPERAMARPEVARAAERYLGLGGEVPASAIVESPKMAKTLEALAGKGDVSAVESFNAALADRIGARGIMDAEGVKGLTPKVLAEAKKQLYDGFDTFASQRGVVVDPPLITELRSITSDAKKDIGSARPETVKAVQDAVKRVVDVALGNPNFTMTGKEFRALTSSGSVLDDLFKHDHAATPYAERLKEALYSALERTLPEARQEIDQLRSQYRDLLRLEKVAPSDPTGLISPKKVASRYGKLTDDFGEIARMGGYLPAATPAGAVKESSLGTLAGLAERVLPGIGKNALGVGAGLGIGGGIPPLVAMAMNNPWGAAGVGAAGLATLGVKHGLASRYGSQDYTRKVIENTLRPQAPTAWPNPLLALIPMLSQRQSQ